MTNRKWEKIGKSPKNQMRRQTVLDHPRKPAKALPKVGEETSNQVRNLRQKKRL
jgi:hypothetical protein